MSPSELAAASMSVCIMMHVRVHLIWSGWSEKTMSYPLVNQQFANWKTTMFNGFCWVNHLFLPPFSIAFCMFTRPGNFSPVGDDPTRWLV